MTSDWDFTPDRELLAPFGDEYPDTPTFEACLNAHGMYETNRFVLRLSPRNHELVNSLTSGQHRAGDISPEALQAYSTYIHETVHWWQHVGSASGFLLSLSYLGQAHSSIRELREVISAFGPIKPLKRWADNTLKAEGPNAQERLAPANIAVNNALDVEYYKAFAYRPKQAVKWLVEQPHFECIGHGYHMAYGQLLGMLSRAFDPEFAAIPDAPKWDQNFRKLTDQQHRGHYWGSPIEVAPIGLHAIYEGQARFVQLQFLSSTYLNAPTCEDWRDLGYLSGVYVEAFDWFLKLTDSDLPETLDDPLVGLFLLICDLAINPTRGFPLEIDQFEGFIPDVDVGMRFVEFCRAVCDLPHLRTSIREYSREEYIGVSAELAAATGFDQPLDALAVVCGGWKLCQRSSG